MKPNLKSLRLTMLLLLSSLALLSYAVPAYPGLIDFKQPDGNIVKIRMKGSESLKWAETEDGYTLLYDKVGNLVYAELDNKGDLVPSDFVATDIATRPADVIKRLQATSKRLTYSASQLSMATQLRQVRAAQIETATKVSATGDIKMLVILVEFSDHYFQKSKEDFNKLINQLNYTDGGRYGSVRDYFRECSFGQLDLVTDIVGIYRLSNTRAYYGANKSDGNDSRPVDVARDAIKAVNNDINFKDYDANNDGHVDGIHIIYAGPGEEAGGGSDCVWAHSLTVPDGFTEADGVLISRYSCSPEIRGSGGNNITHIGVICHEIGHVLGTKDFYDTDYGTDGEYPGTGDWDIMGTGSWNAEGACPAHFNPYSKIYDFGWATAKTVGISSSQKLSAKDKNSFIRINTTTSGEYFLLEYRAQSGFDSKIPGHGLMIYRATDNLSKRLDNRINATHKQQFYPVVANASYALPTSTVASYGTVNATSAPFPGTYNVTQITDDTSPSMKCWNGTATKLPISSISENRWEEYVTFDVAAKIVNQSITPASGTSHDISTIRLTFDRPAFINSSVGSISITSSDPNDYGKNIKASMSNDGLTATITCSPSKSAWTLGQTYRMEIPAGYFANSQGLKSDAIYANWFITPKRFTHSSVSPAEGIVDSIEEIVLTFPVDFVSIGGAYPVIDIWDDKGNIVSSVATVKTTDSNGNPALKATLDAPITAKGTYRVAFFDSLLIDTSGTMLNDEIFLSWTIESAPFAPIVTPVAGEVSAEELSHTTITLPAKFARFDKTIDDYYNDIYFLSPEGKIWCQMLGHTSVGEDGLSIDITWDFTPTVGGEYTLVVPAGCITLDNGAKNVETKVTYTVADNIAKSITLDKTSVEITTTERISLLATVLPDNTTNKAVTWKSSDNTVATVDANGVVTAIAMGKTIITATTTDGTNLSASCIVTVIPTPGDVNNDGNINITDVVTVASYILGNTPHTFIFDAADLTNDGTINIVDIVTIANIILNNEAPEESLYASRVATQYAMESRFFIEDFSIQAKETKTIAVNLTNDTAFSGFQADIKLPEGLELCQEDGEYMISLSTRKGNDHVLTSAMRSDGTIRLLSYSMSLNEFDDTEGALVYLTVTAANNFIGNYEISLNNITFTQADLSEYSLEPTICHLTSTSGIEDVNGEIIVTTIESGIVVKNAPLGSNVRVYAADGSIVASKVAIDGNVVVAAPIKSLYIVTVDGKSFKVMVK